MHTKLTKANILRAVGPSLLICSAFILCAALGMLINPEAFHKFFSASRLIRAVTPESHNGSYYWDVEHYANMALNPRCAAFYPLWPLLIRILFHPQSVEQAAHSFLLVATILFFISIFPLYWVFKKAFKRRYLALLLALAYSLNPMSIFHVIGYTESLFSILTILFMYLMLKHNLNLPVKVFLIFIITSLMALTRPVLIQILFSSSASLATIIYFESLKIEISFWKNLRNIVNKYIQLTIKTINIWLAAILGYSLYGTFCLNSRGDFFAPFQDQKYWGKRLGLHLELLFLPRSLLFDLLGLYLPLIVLFLSLTFVYFKLRNESPYIFIPNSALWNVLILYPPLLILLYLFKALKIKLRRLNSGRELKQLKTCDYTKTLSENYLFWFCVYFTTANSAIVFLTQDRLYSLARYVFGVPFFFMALGYLCRCIPSKKTYKALVSVILISAIALVQQWVRYGQDDWLG